MSESSETKPKTSIELLGDCNLSRSLAALESIVETAERVEELRGDRKDFPLYGKRDAVLYSIRCDDALDELRAKIVAWRRWCRSDDDGNNSDSTSSIINTL